MAAMFEPVAFAAIEERTRRHLRALPETIDSFLEDHILSSAHYRIVLDGEPAGFASVHAGSLITQFALDEPHRRDGQPVFARLRRMEQVQSAFVPTCDEFYLAHALDEYLQLAKQAYFFAIASDGPVPQPPPDLAQRPAGIGDVPLIRRESGGFFDPIERHVSAGELFVTLRAGEPVAFGLMIRSALYQDVASIGMYTIDRCRRQGAGTATIALLIRACRDRGLRPVAGCWYYNHASKRTLESAGLYSPTRLLKVEF